MNMHDNDLDQLFRSKLDDFEMAPSKNLWAGIAEGLDEQQPRKKSLIPMLRIAASVAVVVTAGVLFYPKNNIKPGATPNYKPAANHTTAATTQDQSTPANPVSTSPVVNPPASTGAVINIKANPQIAALSHKVHTQRGAAPTMPSVNTDPQTTAAIANQPGADAQQPVLAAADPVKAPVNTGSVPDNNIKLKPADTDPQGTIVATPAAVLASNPDKPAKKHRIHNFGDLVNAVVSKVDKRADKVVEFTESDDESNITGINLGFLKIKKDK